MRPSVQLPSVSGVDSKLGLPVVRPSLQSAPEPAVLDLPIGKHFLRQICSNFLTVFTSVALTSDLFN